MLLVMRMAIKRLMGAATPLPASDRYVPARRAQGAAKLARSLNAGLLQKTCAHRARNTLPQCSATAHTHARCWGLQPPGLVCNIDTGDRRREARARVAASVCIHVHIHIHICTYICMYIYVYVHIYMYVIHVYVCMYMNIYCRYVYMYMYTYVRVSVRARVCVCVCVCMYVCIYSYVGIW